MRDARARAMVTCIATLSLVAGCSKASAPSDRSATKTPQITVAAKGELAWALLTTEDLRSTAGLPPDIAVARLSDLSVYADPDPRGPCGAKVPVLDLTGAAGVGITSVDVGGAELVARSSVASATAYLEARVHDAVAGCAEYQTVNHRGDTQRVHLSTIITLDLPVDQSLATQRAILVGGKVTSATLIELRKGDVVAKVALFAATPPPAATVQALAARVAAHLEGS